MFFGREEILEQLDAQLASPIASIVTCRGRRRIGKSTLIEGFAASGWGARPAERSAS